MNYINYFQIIKNSIPTRLINSEINLYIICSTYFVTFVSKNN